MNCKVCGLPVTGRHSGRPKVTCGNQACAAAARKAALFSFMNLKPGTYIPGRLVNLKKERA